MSGYILCRTKRTQNPYFISNISMNIYSLEELCYYLYHNLHLIDYTLINEALTVWIREELELPALAAKIAPHVGKFANLEDVLYPIFKEINYLSYEELRDLNTRLSELSREDVYTLKKKKGDAFMENDMYVKAIRQYQDLAKEMEEVLEKDEKDEREREAHFTGLLSAVQHNLGCAYARLFQMEKAIESFLSAWHYSPTEENLVIYLTAFCSVRTPLEYENRLKELNVPEEAVSEAAQRRKRFSRVPEAEVYSQDVDPLILKITRDYHRSTGA